MVGSKLSPPPIIFSNQGCGPVILSLKISTQKCLLQLLYYTGDTLAISSSGISLMFLQSNVGAISQI